MAVVTPASKAKMYARLYADSKKYAMHRAGGEAAFWICGPTFRTALVAQAILQNIYQQDESIPAETVVATVSALYDLLTSDESLHV